MMRLLKVRVREFRCIEDSTEFSIGQVTCLVGKNESGKTAILKALHKLKPGEPTAERFEPRDYPRRKWRPDVQIPNQPPAIETTWELEEEDVLALSARFGERALTNRQFTITKGYDNVSRYCIEADHSVVVKKWISEQQLPSDERKQLSGCRSPEAAIDVLEAMSPRTATQERLLVALKADFPKGAAKAIREFVSKRVPTILYFDEYLTLPGTVAVNEIMVRKGQNALTPKDRVFLALLSLAGTTLDSVHGAGTFEEFNASLRAVSNQITDQIFKYWTQNKHLDVEIRLDQARQGDTPPFNNGWIVRTRIENRRHRADTSFDDRSRGFVWFFSFLVWFYQLRQAYGNNLIILLDEPGLSLHARAQGDLLRYINEQLSPSHQVIYTTHSPFMVDSDNLLSARTVEDVVKKRADGEEVLLGTKVGEEVLSTDPDTVSPLQRALGYDLSQTLFIGRHTLLVEGESDLLYLKWFSRQLQKRGSEGLDYRWSICVVRGVDRVPGFASLFRGNGLNIAAAIDMEPGNKNRIDNARKALREGHLLTMDTFAEQKEADIEDVLGREFYFELVSRALGLRAPDRLPKITADGGQVRVVKEVQAQTGTLPSSYPEFNHYVPAEWLFQRADEGCELPGYNFALGRMEKLITALNALIE